MVECMLTHECEYFPSNIPSNAKYPKINGQVS